MSPDISINVTRHLDQHPTRDGFSPTPTWTLPEHRSPSFTKLRTPNGGRHLIEIEYCALHRGVEWREGRRKPEHRVGGGEPPRSWVLRPVLRPSEGAVQRS